MIISVDLVEHQVEALISVLRRYKRAIGWTIADIISISPSICTHKIQLKEDCTPTIEHQRRLNPPMQEAVKKEIIKWLDTKVVYPISNSKWVSPIQYVPKKGGMTVVANEKNELIPLRPITGWRVCMDYCKLNTWTLKDHFVFMDDFSVIGDSFELCLVNLSRALQRCEEFNLVLNWEKCHFMVKGGIVLVIKFQRR